jgi:hypothetical protein
VHVLTPYEVAKYLDIEGATQPADQFGDVVLAASIGRSARHVLTLHTAESQKFNQLYQYMQMQRVGAVALGVLGVLYAVGIILMMYGTYVDASRQEAMKADQQKKLNLVRLAIRQSSTDVEKTNDIIDLYAQLEKERFLPTPMLDRIQKTVTSAVDIKGVEVAYDEPVKVRDTTNVYTPNYGTSSSPASSATAPTVVTATLTLEFPGVTTLEAFKPVSIKLVSDLRAVFPGFDISYTRLPSVFSENEKLDMTFGDNKTTESNALTRQSLDVVLTVSGRADLLDTLPDMVAAPAGAAQEPAVEEEGA